MHRKFWITSSKSQITTEIKMTEMPYNQRRRLLSAAKDLMNDIQRHTESMQTALSFVNSEKSESFHANEIVDDTIMLEMLLEDFKGDIPEEFEPFQKEVAQRRKMYGDLFGDQWYENKRTYLEEELAEAASVPEATEAEKEQMRREPRIRRVPYERKEKKPKKPKVPLIETGKIVRIYSFDQQQAIKDNPEFDNPEFNTLTSATEKNLIHPLEARLERGDVLFDELPEHFTIVCLEEDQQIIIDYTKTMTANPYYQSDKTVFSKLQAASNLGKNMFRLQQLYEKLKGEHDGE